MQSCALVKSPIPSILYISQLTAIAIDTTFSRPVYISLVMAKLSFREALLWFLEVVTFRRKEPLPGKRGHVGTSEPKLGAGNLTWAGVCATRGCCGNQSADGRKWTALVKALDRLPVWAVRFGSWGGVRRPWWSGEWQAMEWRRLRGKLDLNSWWESRRKDKLRLRSLWFTFFRSDIDLTRESLWVGVEVGEWRLVKGTRPAGEGIQRQ